MKAKHSDGSQAAGRAPVSAVFAQFGDPQIGFGREQDEALDEARLTACLRQCLEAGGRGGHGRVAGLLVCGDLVQEATSEGQWRRVRAALAEVPTDVAVLLVPGNHEVPPVKSPADVDRFLRLRDAYCAEFGPDQFVASLGSAVLLAVDSEVLVADHPALAALADSHWQWLDASARVQRTLHPTSPMCLLLHRPPFVHDEREQATHFNFPLELRARLLGICRTHGIRHIFAGHCHRSITAHAHDITIHIAGGTARTFDHSPFGFNRCVLYADNTLDITFCEMHPGPHAQADELH